MSARRLLVQELTAIRGRLGVAIVLFVVVNLFLAGLYLWSRGGQTTRVHLVARGSEFAAYVDGKLTAESGLLAPQQGGLVLTVDDTVAVRLPDPSGIASVRVTDLTTKQLLFEDNFSSGPAAEWIISGHPLIGRGVIGSLGTTQLALLNRSWQDYAVDVTYKNIQRATIMVRAQSADTGVRYDFRAYRQYDNRLTLLEGSGIAAQQEGNPVQLARNETVKSLVAMSLEPYPRIFPCLAGGLIVVVLLQFVSLFRPGFARVRLPTRMGLEKVGALGPYAWWLSTFGIALVGFAGTLYLIYSYGSHMPHVPDEVAYIFQAKVLAMGRVSVPPPPVQGSFDYFYPPFIIVSHGRWFGVYPFGHPLLLALGARLGAIWLMPPLTGAATIVLIFAIGRKLYGQRVGLLAALILVTSPFFLMTASNFMSHNTAAFYLLASLFFLTIAERRPMLYGALAGLFFGLLFNTQALSSVALIPALALLMLSGLLASDRRRVRVGVIAAFAAAALLMFGAYALYNWRTTGDPFQSGLQIGVDAGQTLGFGGQNTPNIGLQNLQAMMSYFRLVLTGWPSYVGLGFSLLPFILATRKRWDWFFLIAGVSALVIYVLFIGNGIAYGPRYWYVVSPLFILLAARGADRAAEVLAGGVGTIRRAWSRADRPTPYWPGYLVVYSVVLALIGSSVHGWVLGKHTSWSNPSVPKTARAMRNFYSVDDRLINLVDDAHLHHSLVLVQGCPGWACYGSVFWLNSPMLDSDVIFASDVPDRRDALLQAFPNRAVYLADYEKRSLDRYVPSGLGPQPPP